MNGSSRLVLLLLASVFLSIAACLIGITYSFVSEEVALWLVYAFVGLFLILGVYKRFR